MEDYVGLGWSEKNKSIVMEGGLVVVTHFEKEVQKPRRGTRLTHHSRC